MPDAIIAPVKLLEDLNKVSLRLDRSERAMRHCVDNAHEEYYAKYKLLEKLIEQYTAICIAGGKLPPKLDLPHHEVFFHAAVDGRVTSSIIRKLLHTRPDPSQRDRKRLHDVQPRVRTDSKVKIDAETKPFTTKG